MVAIVSGNSLGLTLTSLNTLGQGGNVGDASLGRTGERVYINAANGNLVIQDQDELLMGRGLDIGTVRTYNSQGLLNDDNGDNWRLSAYKSVTGLTGTVNTSGSTVTRTDADGAVTVYTYTIDTDTTQNKYVNKDGAGSYDSLSFSSGTWTWTDGDSRVTETYDNTHGGRLGQRSDTDGNSLIYSYDSSTGLISQVKNNASGESTYLDYTSNNLSQIRTVRSDATTLTRVRYGYDTANRLNKVTVDLTPDDNSIVDAKTFVTSYTYDGASKRVASITEGNGTTVTFTYVQVGSDWKVASYTDGIGKTTSLTYAALPTTANANNAVLSTTMTLYTDYLAGLNSAVLTTTETTTVAPYYLVKTGDTWAAITQAVYGTSNTSAVSALQTALNSAALSAGVRLTVPQTLTYTVATVAAANNAVLTSTTATTSTLNSAALITSAIGWTAATQNAALNTTTSAFGQNGNGMAVWQGGTGLNYSIYNSNADSWSVPVLLDAATGGASAGSVNVSSSPNGNMLVTWVVGTAVYVRRLMAGTWGSTTQIQQATSTGNVTNQIGAINDAGRAVVVTRMQPSSGTRSVFSASTFDGAVWKANVTIDDPAMSTEIATSMAPRMGIDPSGNANVVWMQKAGAETSESLFFTRYNATSASWSAASSTAVENTTGAVASAKTAVDGQGNGLAVWIQNGMTYAKSYSVSTGTWGAVTTLGAGSANTVVTLSANGNGLVTWKNGIDIYARRYSAGAWLGTSAELVGTTLASANAASGINNAGQAVVSFVQTGTDGLNHIYSNLFSGGVWKGATLNGNTATLTLRATINNEGTVGVFWQSSASNAMLASGARFTVGTPYYTVPSGATWTSVATVLYGSGAVASQLQNALGNPPLTVGNRLSGFPASLTASTPVAPYYTVKTGDTWATISQSVYGTGNAAAIAALQTALGNATLTAGTKLVVPQSLNYNFSSTVNANSGALLTTVTTLVPPYYTIPANATWASIATTLYDDVKVASQLQTALGNPALTAGTRLTGLPESFMYSTPSTVTVAPYYRVLAGDTWASIVRTIYGAMDADVDAAEKLKQAMGNTALSAGKNLTVPQTLTYLSTLIASSLQTDITDPLGYTTTFITNAQGQFSSVLSPVIGTPITAGISSTLVSTTDTQTNTVTVAPYYLVKSGDTWATITQAVYGTSSANTVTALKIALNTPALSTDLRLTVPQTLTSSAATVAVANNAVLTTSIAGKSYSTNKTAVTIQPGATWESTTSNIYGPAAGLDPAAVAKLRSALGNPQLTVGATLTGYPATLTVTTPVTPYYTVKAGDSWATITQIVYGSGNAAAIAALQTALGNATLSAGTKLVVPQSLNYNLSSTINANNAGLLTTLTTTNTITVPPYYTIPANATWATIATTLYGDANAATKLAAVMGNPALTAGTRLTALPASLSYSTAESIANATRTQTTYVYNANGDVVSVTDGRGQVTNYDYDQSGNQILARDAAGNAVSRTYGPNNELLTETHYLVPDPDGVGAAQATVPVTVRYAYDGHKHLRYSVSAEGRVTEYRYNNAGQREAAIQYTANAYNAGALAAIAPLAESAISDWVAATVVDKRTIVRTDYAYDFRGQLDTVTSYAQTDAAGNGVPTGSSKTQYVYDQAGNLLSTIDARGMSTTADPSDYITSYTYDGLGRRKTATQWASGTQSMSSITQYDDASNRIVTKLNDLITTTSAYNLRGDLLSVGQSGGGTNLGSSTYQYDADGRLRMVTDPAGVKNYHLYDEAGRKVADIDGDGSLAEYVYNLNGQLSKTIRYASVLTADQLSRLTDGQGKPAAVSLATLLPPVEASDQMYWNAYDSANRLAKTVDAAGNVTENRYDGAGRLTEVIRYANAINIATLSNALQPGEINSVVNLSEDRHSRYLYDADGKLLATIDGEGFVIEHRYDAAGQLVQNIAYANASANALGNTMAQVRPVLPNKNDIYTYFLHDGKGQVVGRVDSEGLAAGEGYLTETAFDAVGHAETVTRYATKVSYTPGKTLSDLRPVLATEDHTVITTYDGLNRIASATDAQGTKTQYFYNTLGNLNRTDITGKAVNQNQAELRSLRQRYDLQGHVVRELSAEGSVALNALVNPTQATIDQLWDTYSTRHTYDLAGRLTSTTDANAHKTVYYYGADGSLAFTVNPAGEVFWQSYDGLNQVVRTRQFATRVDATVLAAGLSGGLLDANSMAMAYALAAGTDLINDTAYTATGMVSTTSHLNDLSRVTLRHYNAFGEEDERATKISETETLIQTFQYDKRGLQVATAADPYGINAPSNTHYDAFGRAVSTTDANGNITRRTFDRLGRVVDIFDPANASLINPTRHTTYDAFDRILTQTDGLSQTTTYVYNSASRSVSMKTPEGVEVVTEHNGFGQTTKIAYHDNYTTAFEYDKNGNLKKTTNALTSSFPQNKISATNDYDKTGLLKHSVDAAGHTIDYTYDAANRVLTRTVDQGGLNLVTRYEYDAKGQQVTVTDPNGNVTATAFDLAGQVTTQTIDPAGLNLITSFSYDGRGKTLTVTAPGGMKTQYVYDKLGRRTEEHIDPDGLNITHTYKYDKSGNVISSTIVDAVNGVPSNRTTRYVYDADDRLRYTINAKGELSENRYDAAGNITLVKSYVAVINNFASLPSVPTLNEILSRIVTSPGQDVEENRFYDTDNRLSITVDGMKGVVQFTYDKNNNVTERRAYATPLSSFTLGQDNLESVKFFVENHKNAATDQRVRSFYDGLHRVTYRASGTGSVTGYMYDGVGNVTQQVDYAAAISKDVEAKDIESVVGGLVDVTNDRVTSFVYDNANRLVFRIDALGGVTQKKYDDDGNLSESIAFSRPFTVIGGSVPTLADLTSWAAQGPQQTNPGNNSTRILYDRANRPVLVIDAAKAAVGTQYDAAGNAVLTRNYSTLSDGFNAPVQTSNDRVTQRVFDKNNRMVFLVDASNYVTKTEYDAAGNITKTIDYPQAIAVTQGQVLTVQHVLNGLAAATSTMPVQPYTYVASATNDQPKISTTPLTVEVTTSNNDTLVSWPVALETPEAPYRLVDLAYYDERDVSSTQVMVGVGQRPYTYVDSAHYDERDVRTDNVSVSVVDTTTGTVVEWASPASLQGAASVKVWYQQVANSPNSPLVLLAPIAVAGRYQVSVGEVAPAGSRYVIKYFDAEGRIVGLATGSSGPGTDNMQVTFHATYNNKSTEATLGSSITGYVNLNQINLATLDVLEVSITDLDDNPIQINVPDTAVNASGSYTAELYGDLDNYRSNVHTLFTRPQFDGDRTALNLSVGKKLADGAYKVKVIVHKNDFSAPEVKEVFRYNVGPTIINWTTPASLQGAASVKVWYQQVANSPNSPLVLLAPIAVAGRYQVSVGEVAPAGSRYVIKYFDAEGRIVGLATGSSGPGTDNMQVTFHATYNNKSTEAVLGSSITGYVNLNQINLATLDALEVSITDLAGNKIEINKEDPNAREKGSYAAESPGDLDNYLSNAHTLFTRPQFDRDRTALNLSVGKKLADGAYLVKVIVHKNDFSAPEVKDEFTYFVGPQPALTIATDDQPVVSTLTAAVTYSALSNGDTVITWPKSGQLTGTPTFYYQADSDHEIHPYPPALIPDAQGNTYQVKFRQSEPVGAGRFIIQYFDGNERITGQATDRLANKANVIFYSSHITPRTSNGLALANYISLAEYPNSQSSKIEHILTEVFSLTDDKNPVASALTYPDFETDYQRQINLSTTPLEDNKTYNIKVTIFKKDLSAEAREIFTYKVINPLTAHMYYQAVSGSTASPIVEVPYVQSGGSYKATIAGAIPLTARYILQYTDSEGRVVTNAVSGSLAVNSGSPSVINQTSLRIASYAPYSLTSASQGSGSALVGVIALADVPEIEHIDATVTKNGAVISTARTSPEFETNYQGSVNLSIGTPLPNGRYHISLAIHKKNLNEIEYREFDYWIGPADVSQLDAADNATLIRTNTFRYDAAGRLDSSTDAEQNRLPLAQQKAESYKYDGVGNKIAFTNKNGATWTYEYDADRRLVLETAPQVEIAYIADATMTVGVQSGVAPVTKLEYDALGNLTNRIEAYGHVQQRTTHYDYDALGRQTTTIYPQVGVYNATNGYTAAAYNAVGRNENETYLFSTVSYDVFGNAISNLDVAGNTSYKVYDKMGRVRYDLDAAGYVTGYKRDGFGQVTTLTRYATPSNINQVRSTQGPDTSTSDRSIDTTYDHLGRVLTVTEPLAYDTKTQGLKAKVTSNTYNAFGNVRQVTTGTSSIFHYFDKRGNETGTVDALGYVTTQQFDAEGNVTGRTEYANALSTNSGNTWNTTSFALPAASGDDRTVRYTYDGNNRKTSETRLNVEYAVQVNGTSVRGEVTTKYQYDAVGNLTVTTTDAAHPTHADGSANPAYTKTTSRYDALGRVTAINTPMREINGSGIAILPLTAFKRDVYGNIVQQIDYASGAQTDGLTAWSPSSKDHKTLTRYDSQGHAIQTADAKGVQHFTSYNARGQVAKQWQSVSDNAAGVMTTQTMFKAFQYDALGRQTHLIDPPTTSVASIAPGIPSVPQTNVGLVDTELRYNAFGEVIQSVINNESPGIYFDYDNAGRVWRTNSDGVDKIILHDALGNETDEIRSINDLHASTITLNTLKAYLDSHASDPAMLRATMTYDAMGRVAQQTSANKTTGNDGGALTVKNAQLNIVGGIVSTTARAASNVTINTSFSYEGINEVNLSWNALDSLGSGDIKVVIAYQTKVTSFGNTGTIAASKTHSQIYSADQAANGAKLTWKDTGTGNAGGISSVSQVQVFKKDVNGNWLQVINRSSFSTIPYGNTIQIAAPTDPEATVALQVRAITRDANNVEIEGPWVKKFMMNFGDAYRFDTDMGNGLYEYQVSLTSPTQTAPFIVSTGGRLTVTGTAVVLTTLPTVETRVGPASLTSIIQTVDRWGNVVKVSDPRSASWLTRYSYNANNQMVRQTQPDALGAISPNSAVTRIFFDALGRQIAIKDARGNVNGQIYDAGGNVAKEVHADGGTITNYYDTFGNKVRVIDALNNQTDFEYDKLNQLTDRISSRVDISQSAGTLAATTLTPATSTLPINWDHNGNKPLAFIKSTLADQQITEHYTYDEAGRRVSSENGEHEISRVRYDRRGNVIATINGLNKQTASAYDTHNRKTAEVDANGTVTKWQFNFTTGRLETQHVTGLGDHTVSTSSTTVSTAFAYDGLGRIKTQTSNTNQNLSYTYKGSQLITIRDITGGQETQYDYDAAGNRVREKSTLDSIASGPRQVLQDNRLRYDTLGRLVDVADNRYHIQTEYDAVGNRIHVTTSHLDDTPNAPLTRQESWNAFDSMNRQTIVDGVKVGSKTTIDVTQGHQIAYDKNGNRSSDQYFDKKLDVRTVAANLPKELTTETYHYDAMNRLAQIKRDDTIIDERHYDGASRVVKSGLSSAQLGPASAGLKAALEGLNLSSDTRISVFDDAGQVIYQSVYRIDQNQFADYNTAGTDNVDLNYIYDNVGNLTFHDINVHAGSDGYYATYTNHLAYNKGAQVAQVDVTKIDAREHRQTKLGSTINQFDANGRLVKVNDNSGGNKSRVLVNDAQGQVLRNTAVSDGAMMHSLIVNGQFLGSSGGQAAQNTVGQTYEPASAPALAAGPSSYTVRGGDTLAGIAKAVWGDANQWYLIADANGLTDADLKAGQVIVIPTRANTIHNDANTFKPYDPSQGVGDVTPALPMPGDQGCGVMGQIIVLIVVIVVAYFTAGAALNYLPAVEGAVAAGSAAAALPTAVVAGTAAGATTGSLIVAGAIGGAVGSIAGQLVGIGIGAQQEFSWKAVALSALGGAVSAGMGRALMAADKGWQAVAARAAMSNAVTQGIGVATGLQEHFDWRGVATAGVSAAVGAGVGNALDGSFSSLGRFGAGVARGALSGIASGVTVAAMRGGSINAQQIATDAFGNALGSSIVGQMQGGASQQYSAMEQAQNTAREINRGSWQINAQAGQYAMFASSGAIMSDMDNPYLGVDIGAPVNPTATSDRVFNALLQGMQNPLVADGPRMTLDDFGNLVGSLTNLYDLSDKNNFKDYLDTVNHRNTNGLSLDPQDIATSKALLFNYFGYPMGAQRGTTDQLKGNLDDRSSSGVTRALALFSQASADEQQQRYDFYSNIQVVTDASGNATRGRSVGVTQDGRMIGVNWDKTFSNTAGTLGVNADEALRKTDFEVYQAAINAAFATEGVRNFNINGAWRPHPADYAAIMGVTSPLPNVKSQHISSRALDINMINGVAINNGGYVNHAPRVAEPKIVQSFTDNLRQENGVRQMFQPWRMWGNAGQLSTSNSDITQRNGQVIIDSNSVLHKNHLHFGF